MTQQQRRGRRIAMLPDEVDTFLGEVVTCRVATIGRDGFPHNTPLWFVWDGRALWLHSLVRSQRWKDLERNPRIAVVVDAGVEYTELRGIEMRGHVDVVGEVPRVGRPNPELEDAERRFAAKYTKQGAFVPDGRHAWLRLVPDSLVSWDFRKVARPT